MEALTLAGIPVYAERGRYGAYRIIEDYTVKRQLISKLEELPYYFPADAHRPFQDEQGWPGDPRPRTLFVLRFDPSALGRMSDYARSDHVKEMPDGALIGFFPFPEDNGVYSWILSFGPHVEVLKPPHARDHIRDLIHSLSVKYTP